MKVIGYRYVTVYEDSKDMVDFFENKLGMVNTFSSTEAFCGGI